MLITLPSQQTTIARLSQSYVPGKNKEMPLYGLHTVGFWGMKNTSKMAERVHFSSGLLMGPAVVPLDVVRVHFSDPITRRVASSLLLVPSPFPQEIVAWIEGTSKGDRRVRSGIKAKVLPSLGRMITFPVDSALSKTLERFCRASE